MTAPEICKLAANGNEAAESFGRSWLIFCRVIDDLVDRDRDHDADTIAAAMVGFIVELAGNPFFNANKAMLTSLMVQGVNAWLDSNERTGAERGVLAGYYHEVIYHIAYLTGGWAKMRELTATAREYKGTD